LWCAVVHNRNRAAECAVGFEVSKDLPIFWRPSMPGILTTLAQRD
jgi:hypothetical protein